MIETQGKILDTAERLFGEHGYAGTSLRQIIAEAGVNLAAIHYHFGNKEELLELLRAFLEPPLLRIKENPDLGRLIGRLYGEGLMPMIAERHFQTVKSRFTAAFRRALPQLSEREVALRLQFMIGAMAHTMLFACQQFSIDANLLIRELVAFIVGGLGAPAVLGENTEEIR